MIMIDSINQQFVSACKEGRINDAQNLYNSHASEIDVDYNNQEAIRFAAEHGRTQIVAILLKTSGVNPSAIDQYALRAASENGHDDVVNLLLQHDKVDPTARKHRALSMACQNGHAKTVELLLKTNRTSAVENDAYPLRLAIKYNHLHVIEVIVEFDVQARAYMQKNHAELLQNIAYTNAFLGYAMAQHNAPLEIAARASKFVRGFQVYQSMKVGYEIYEQRHQYDEDPTYGKPSVQGPSIESPKRLKLQDAALPCRKKPSLKTKINNKRDANALESSGQSRKTEGRGIVFTNLDTFRNITDIKPTTKKRVKQDDTSDDRHKSTTPKSMLIKKSGF